MKARTKEEKFLLSVYEAASEAGDPEGDVDRYLVGQKIGLHPKGINTICKDLAQANFIKKRGDSGIALTQNGLRLVQELLSE